MGRPSYNDIAFIAPACLTLASDVLLKRATRRKLHDNTKERLGSALYECPVEAHDVGVVQRRTVAHLSGLLAALGK